MATTGFWPVRGRLKEVIDYANNPDKTTAKEYLDEDLYAAIRYVENDDKTDQTMYVSGINCSKYNAYNEMIAVKRRFGERGKRHWKGNGTKDVGRKISSCGYYPPQYRQHP